jgi:NADH-quinone oxidoreductase subunit A
LFGRIFASFPMPDNYFARYLPLLIHFLLAGALATGIVLLSWLIGQRKPTRAKLSPYECGMVPVGDARKRFSVKFYMVAMLFILFDVEAVFLYPWAIILKDLKMFGFWEMIVYIGIVLVGFWYIWKKGALDWGLTVSSSQAARISGDTKPRAPSAEPEPELAGVLGRGGG